MNKVYRGIDISLFQGNPDFNKVKSSGIDFVMMKCSQGRNNSYRYPFIDPRFDENAVAYSKIPGEFYAGTYHYFMATSINELEQEIEFYINQLKRYPDTFALWAAIDVEDQRVFALPKNKLNEYLKTFCNALRSEKLRPMIYSSTWYLDNWITVPENVPIWEANYSISKMPDRARIWQSGTGNVPGIAGECDIDYAVDIIGDANGDGKVNARDVRTVMKYLINHKTDIDKLQADVNRDGKINARDVTDIMKIIK